MDSCAVSQRESCEPTADPAKWHHISACLPFLMGSLSFKCTNGCEFFHLVPFIFMLKTTVNVAPAETVLKLSLL